MSKINSEQKKVLIDFMEKNHKKLSKKNPSESDRAYKNELWFELAKLLNCYGPPTKTTKLWKRCWVDLKIKTRNKINDMRQNDQIFLSDFEKKLNEICGLKEDAELMSERNGKLLSNKSPEVFCFHHFAIENSNTTTFSVLYFRDGHFPLRKKSEHLHP